MNVYVRELARALAAAGACVDVFTRAHGAAASAALADRAHVVAIPADAPPGVQRNGLDACVGDFARGIAAHARAVGARYDVVHSHYWLSGLAAGELAASWRIPFVHTHHTVGRVKNAFLPPGDRAEAHARIEAEDEIVTTADLVVASTEGERAEPARQSICVVAPGVDGARYRPDTRLRRLRRPVILYVGRIQPLKGLDLALRALTRLPGFRLIVAGGPSGPRGADELDRLRRLARALDVDARFVGPKPQRELRRLYCAADAAVVCSYSESFGLAALEAQACGTPVVGTAVGGLPTFVRDGESGFVVPQRNADVFAERLEAVLMAGRPMREAAARAAEPFSWTLTARLLLELYSGVRSSVSERIPKRSASFSNASTSVSRS